MQTLLTQNYLSQLSPILGLILSLSVMAFKFELHKKVRINDEKGILLPSFFVLASPFLFSFLFNISLLSILSENKVLSSIVTILTTTTSIYTANFLLDGFRERKKILERAKFFLYKLRESRNYLLQIKDEISKPQQTDVYYLGLRAKVSASLLLENKVPDDLAIFDESIIEQIEKCFTTTKRFAFEIQEALSNKEEEFLRNVMAIRADEAIIEVDLCILFFLVKYFSKLQQTEIQKLKTYFQWKYKKLKEQESEILNNLTLDQSPKYYHVYSIPNIERVFKSLNWDIKR